MYDFTSYWSDIVSIDVSCTIFELYHIQYYRDLEIYVKGHSRSLKMISFKNLGIFSYSHFIVTMAVSWIIS